MSIPLSPPWAETMVRYPMARNRSATKSSKPYPLSCLLSSFKMKSLVASTISAAVAPTVSSSSSSMASVCFSKPYPGQKDTRRHNFSPKRRSWQNRFHTAHLERKSTGKMFQPCHLTQLSIRRITRMKLISALDDADIDPTIDFRWKYHVIADPDLMDKSIEHAGMG